MKTDQFYVAQSKRDDRNYIHYLQRGGGRVDCWDDVLTAERFDTLPEIRAFLRDESLSESFRPVRVIVDVTEFQLAN